LLCFIVAVHGLKLEIGNLGEMKRVYELDVYDPVKALSEKTKSWLRKLITKA